MNSVLYGSAATVSDNYGPGVFLRAASTASFGGGAVITGNGGHGVQLEMNSTAEFGDNNRVMHNEGLDLLCTAGSVAGAPKGTHPVIGRMNCPGWTHLTRRPAWAR